MRVLVLWLFLCVSAFCGGAAAQSVQQSGNVTPGHVAQWTTNGVVQDGGTAASNSITSLGATGPGPVICANSAPVTLPYYQLCLDASDGQILYQALGGATPQSLNFVINGTAGFPVGSLTSIAAGSFLGNPTASLAAPQAFTVAGLTANVAPSASLDYLVMWNHATNALQKVNAGTIASSATAGVSSLGGLTGALTCGTGLLCVGTTVSTTLSIAGQTGTVTLGQGLMNASTVLSTTAGVDTNVLNTQTANYQIATTDCGKTVQAGTGSTGQFIVTLPSVSGFGATCSVVITNGDTGHGKILSGFPTGVNSILWPLQTITMEIVNGAWIAKTGLGRFSLTGSITFYLDVNAGSDSNDGLTTGTAWKTLQFAWNNVADNIDTRGFVVTFQLADGTYSSALVNHGFVGQAGGGSAIIAGHSGNPQAVVIKATGAGLAALDFGSGSDSNSPQVVVQDVYLQSTTGNGINAWGAGTFVALSNVYIFAPLQTLCSSAHGAEMSLRSGTTLFAVSGGMNAFSLINVQQNGRWISDSPNITFIGSPNYTGAVFFAANLGMQFLAGGTFSGAVTGSRYSVQSLGLILTGTGGNPSYLPGSSAGTALFGGIYN